MVRVYSHKRSGTNFLIALLEKNFEFGDISNRITTTINDYDNFINIDEVNESPVFKGNKVTWNHPYGKLFGTHAKCNLSIKNGIYIVRDPRDTLLSLYNLKGVQAKFKDWCTEAKIKNWYTHVKSYQDNGVFIVRYEDLINNFEDTMSRIQEHFDLDMKNDKFENIDKIIGWKGKKGKLEGKIRDKDIYSKELLTTFKKSLPDNFMSYGI
jgi:hypothetical protein